MASKCFPKIWPWRNRARCRDRNAGGSITLISIFVGFLFIALGLGLIQVSRIYSKFSAHRKNLVGLACAAENGIKEGFERFVERSADREGPTLLTEEIYAALRQDVQAGGKRAVEEAVGMTLPWGWESAEGVQTWRMSIDFAPGPIIWKDDYFLADFRGRVASEGMLLRFNPRKKASLEASLKILAGKIPLAYFPLLIAKNLSPNEKRDYLENQGISFLPPGQGLVSPQMSFADEAIMPTDAEIFLKKALNIKVFSPDKLTRAELRSALGLEMVNEPVPEGVYLIHNDAGIGGVFVQGDLDELILAIENGYQVILFRRESARWILKFCPAQGKSSFETPMGTTAYDRIPLGMLLVNGRILSLGGGKVNPSGVVEIVTTEAVPCVLDGVSLVIVSADQISLSSHLIQEGVRWQDGIPYLKDATSQLTVYASGRDLIEDNVKSGQIIVGAGAPVDLKLQASLTAKDSIEVRGVGKTAHVTGGIQTAGLTLNGNALSVLPDERFLSQKIFPSNSPAVQRPMLTVLAVLPRQWNE